ncbi:MAG TPA: cupin domain-containing protein [Acidobacteriaceae bacterium]|jgi:quercetin dioxygenase-like cupin family protein|nr:cupin domain-containing protein [Acidobacteriaceae bacterium]
MKRLTRRDLTIALISVAASCCAFAAIDAKPAVLGFTVYDWNSIPVQKTDVGESRQFLRAPTATLDQLEVHATTLKPGLASHPPHRHANEELIIVDRGTLAVFGNGVWKTVGPGSVIFNASNSLHGVKNAGSTPATYHVVSFVTDKTLALEKSTPAAQ